MPKVILVTGAAGFIGSHCASAFLQRGDKVVGLDNINDYYDPALKHANLERVQRLCPDPEQFVFVKGDVRDRQLVESLFAEHGFDAVLHLAAMAGVRYSMDHPHLYWEVNLTGTLNLVNAAHMNGVGNFVFASTSSVYGNSKTSPLVETQTCDRPLAAYAASKRSSELLGHTYHHLYGLNFTALRFFTVYGPGGRPDMMANKVLQNMFFGTEVPLYNQGQMHRDWTYIDDIVSGCVAAVDRPLGYEIFNVGRGETTLLADFISELERLAGRKSHLTPAPMMSADVTATLADISKARRLLGYDPQTSVYDGLRNLWEWFRDDVLKGDV